MAANERMIVLSLKEAAYHGNQETVEQLVNNNLELINRNDSDFDISTQRGRLHINMGLNGNTALMVAAKYGRVKIVLFLLSKGADKNLRNPFTGNTALDHAIANQDNGNQYQEIIQLLLQPALGSTPARPQSVNPLIYVGVGIVAYAFYFYVISNFFANYLEKYKSDDSKWTEGVILFTFLTTLVPLYFFKMATNPNDFNAAPFIGAGAAFFQAARGLAKGNNNNHEDVAEPVDAPMI